MRIIISLFLILHSIFFSISGIAGSEESLDQKINEFKKLQEVFKTKCPQGAQTPSSSYHFSLNSKSMDCKDLQIALSVHGSNIDSKVSELRVACEEETKLENLARVNLKIAKKASELDRPTDAICLGEFACGAASILSPVTGVLAAGATFAGLKNSCVNSGVNNIPACGLQILKGVFDNLATNLSFLWDAGKLAVRKIGEYSGIIGQHELSSSEKLLAAQNANNGFIAQFKRDPAKAIQKLMGDFYKGLKTAAMNSYGCEKWSGIPFNSECKAPMTNWDQASCKQRIQLFCGIGGFAAGELVTAFLTGGMVEIGKAGLTGVKGLVQASKFSKAAAASFREAELVAKSIPKVSAGLKAATLVLKSSSEITVKAWDKVAKGISFSYTGIKKVPVLGAYLKATENAAIAGSLSANRGLQMINVGVATSNAGITVSEAALLKDPERIDLAKDVIGKKTEFSSQQSNAIIEAHRVGSSDGRGMGTYSLAELRKKTKILKDAGFNPKEIRAFMKAGVTGSPSISIVDYNLQKSSVNSSGNAEKLKLVESNLLGRPLTQDQTKSLLHIIDDMDPSDISAIVEQLRNANFTYIEMQALLDKGVIGDVKISLTLADDVLENATAKPQIVDPWNPPAAPTANSLLIDGQREIELLKRKIAYGYVNGTTVGIRAKLVEDLAKAQEKLDPLLAASFDNLLSMIPSKLNTTLQEVGELDQLDRIKLAKELVSPDTILTVKQTQAISSAHDIGLSEGRGYGTYTLTDISQKTKILKDSGFSSDQIRILMDKGVTGALPKGSITRSPAITDSEGRVVPQEPEFPISRVAPISREKATDEILQWTPNRNIKEPSTKPVWSSSTLTQMMQKQISSTPTLKTLVDVHMTETGGQVLVAQIRGLGTKDSAGYEIMRERLQRAIQSIEPGAQISETLKLGNKTPFSQTQWMIDINKLNRKQVDAIVSALDFGQEVPKSTGKITVVKGASTGVSSQEIAEAKKRADDLKLRFFKYRDSLEVIRNGPSAEGKKLLEDVKEAEMRVLELKLKSGVISTPAKPKPSYDSAA